MPDWFQMDAKVSGFDPDKNRTVSGFNPDKNRTAFGTGSDKEGGCVTWLLNGSS